MTGVKSVLLKINQGDFERGFEVTLRIPQSGSSSFVQVDGKLPPAPNIPKIYENWRKNYSNLDWYFRGRVGESIEPGKIPEQCRQSSQKFRADIKAWLNNAENREFQKIREILIREFQPKDEIRVLIQTQDEILKKLPWEEWDLFSDTYTQAEIVLSPVENQVSTRITTPAKPKPLIKILAILGSSEGINIQEDREFLESLPNAETLFIVEPQRPELSDRLWEQNWDILFFAGHSSSNDARGNISINPNEILTLGDLKHGLRRAVERGLQLAIFNSCDGLKLAEDLADLHIPQVIVMREPVPDRFAQKFLKYFLSAFSSGESLYLAVRKARERLHTEGLEHIFPGVTWLPIIYQNPAFEPPTWETIVEPGIYRKLRELLKLGNWRDADKETRAVMLKVSGREIGQSLRVEDKERFPCEDLRMIDALWVHYSKGHFGLSVQKRIWHEVGGKSNPNSETYRCFGLSVGWRENGIWLDHRSLTFSLEAPPGHFPIVTPMEEREDLLGFLGFVAINVAMPLVGFGPGWWAIYSRAEACGL